MPSYQDFERDYHADDRDEVLARMRAEQGQAPPPTSTFPGAPTGQSPNGTTVGSASTGTERNPANAPSGSTGQSLASAWNNIPTRQFEGSTPPPPGQNPSRLGASGASVPTGGTQPFDRTAFRDQWMAMPEDRATQDAFLRQYGLTPDGAGRVTLPTGEVLDLRFGARAGGLRPTWTAVGGSGDGGSGSGSGGGRGSSGTPSTSVVPNNPNSGMPTGVSGQLYQTLLDRINQSTNVGRNDPTIRGQADAYSANEERARRNYLADLAERSGPNANLRGEQRLASERAGQRTGTFESSLMAQELTARRNEIQQSLQQLGGQLTADQQIALQRELGLLNNAIQRAQVDNQSRGLDLQGRGLDQQWQSTLLNNQQFMQQLGLQAEDRGSYWDAVRSGLL